MKKLVLLFLGICLFFSCSEKKERSKTKQDEIPPSDFSGNELATIHCAKCHAFTPPNLLPKSIWKNDVLPSMGNRLGIFKGDHQPDSLFNGGASIIKAAGIYPEKPILAQADWTKIVDYYLKNAPDSVLPPKRDKKINMGLKHFKYKESSYSNQPPLTVMVKILPKNRGVVYSDGKRNTNRLTFLTSDLEKNYQIGLKATPIHYYEKLDTLYLTTIGKNVFPHDAPDGSLQKVFGSKNGQKYNTAKVIIPNLQRPVFMAYGDLNNDGLDDIVACEYGNHTGKLVWFENKGKDQYLMRPLRNKPGAITALLKDINNDGFNDIIVLMAQGDEGVFLYKNNGNGTFEESRLLSFSPLNGSQYIELADFNNDGYEDIIYVCGDNADKTPILKDYHGIYIYINDGNYNFEQSYFYQLNGAYKAMPRDYDLDGDLDIAAISFFPDYYNSPEESFVYLENKGNLEFIDYSFPQATNGRWMVMDAGDMDDDGDIDLALGSFVYFVAQGDTTGLGEKWLSTGPSIIILENTVR